MAGRRIPGALLLPAGLAVIVIVAQLAVREDATAELAMPAVVIVAAAGFVVTAPWRDFRPDPWITAATIAVFAAFAVPVVLSGEATFAGYIKLDDTATWLALTDRVMEHGRSIEGLPPSSYEATLDVNLTRGYPVGSLLPLGVGEELLGEDPAWLFQPYLAWLGAVLALSLSSLAQPLIASSKARALVAFIAAQPALLYGYALWGGVKEMAAAALIGLAAALVSLVVPWIGVRAAIPLALAAAAVVSVLSVGGVFWLAPLLLGALVLLVVTRGRAAAWPAIAFAALLGIAALPALAGGRFLPPSASSLTSGESLGNLVGPLSPFQLFGVWPVGDFRYDPVVPAIAIVLLVAVGTAAVLGVLGALRARAWPLLIYVVGVLVGCIAIALVGSPWVDAKAFAMSSSALLLAAAVGGAGLVARGHLLVGGPLLAAVGMGVLWSNALAYQDVNLAPGDQLSELESIGERIAGQGDTLMTEYQPYGVRHFLRDAAPEGASELRRSTVPLRDGGVVRKGLWADSDEFDPDALMAYRTLVLRRSPEQSRPPAPYELLEVGDYYEVWQRPPDAAGTVVRHLALDDGVDPSARVRCSDVRRLADLAPPGGSLAAARPAVIDWVGLDRVEAPQDWGALEHGSSRLAPRGEGSVEAELTADRSGTYGVWLGGSVRSGMRLQVDGTQRGQVRHELNNAGQYIHFGEVELAPGNHALTFEYAGPDLHSGSDGLPFAIGPIVLSRSEAADARVKYVDPQRADALCGRRWDWIEVVR